MTADLDLFLAQEGEEPLRKNAGEGALFLSELSYRDLQRLRLAVKRIYMRTYPVEFFTDREADRMIEALAPSIAQRMIEAVVDDKLERRTGGLNEGFLRLDR